MSLARFGARDFLRSTDGGISTRRRRKRLQDRNREAGLRAESLEARAMLAANVLQVYTTVADGTYGVGDQIPILIKFDQNVTVTAGIGQTPWLYLNSGRGLYAENGNNPQHGVAKYVGPVGGDLSLQSFLYIVTAGDSSADLDVFSSNSANDAIGGTATFQDAALATFSPVFPVFPQTNRMSYVQDVVIRTTPVVPTVNALRINPQIEITDPPYWMQHPDYFMLHGTAGTSALRAGDVLTVTVNGATYRPTVANDGTWAVDLRRDTPFSGTKNPWSTTDGATYEVVARVTDTGGNSSVDATMSEVTIDMAKPSIAGLVFVPNPDNPDNVYGVGDTIRFSVVFNEAMALGGGGTGTPINLPYINLSNGRRAILESPTATGITGSRLNFAYTIQAGDTSAGLTLENPAGVANKIWLNGQRIQDLAANQPSDLKLGTYLEIPDYLNLPDGITVDTTAPVVAAGGVLGLAADGWYGPGQTIVLEVDFNDEVFVTGNLELALNSGTGVKATMIPLTDPLGRTKKVQFTYTVGDTDSTTSFKVQDILKAKSAGALTLAAGASVVDRAGNPAVLTLPDVTFSAATGFGNKYYITPQPAVTGVTSPNLNGTYTTGDQITIIVQFDRPISLEKLPGQDPVAVFPSLRLNPSPTAPVATYDSNTNSAADEAAGRIVLTYTVAAGEFTPQDVDLNYLETTSFQSGGYAITHGATIAGGAGHIAAILTLPSPLGIGSLDYNKNIRIVRDQFAPQQPVITLVDGTGLGLADNVTFNPRVNVTGLEPLSTWAYSFDAGNTWSDVFRTNADPTLNFFNLPAGDYAPGDILVYQTDASNNDSLNATNPVRWIVDTTAPGTVTGAITDTNIAGDGITRNQVVNVTGVEPDAQVQFSTAGSTGAFAAGFGSTFTLPVGTYVAGSIWVRQMDKAGNIGAATAVNPSGPVTVDTSAAALTVSLLNDTGVSAIDLVTADPTLAFGTSLETGATVEYFDGAWSTSYNPVEGTNNVLVRQVDLAGNVSPTTKFTFTLDRTAPLAVTVSLALDTGSSATDLITSNPSLNVAGTEAGATLEYSVNGGAWSTGYSPSDGLVTVLVRQRDRVGNASPASAPLTFTLDRTAPTAPTVILALDTGTSAADKITSNPALVIGGVDPGATIFYSVNGGAYSTAYGPVEGSNTVLVKQVDLAGNESTARTFVFVLDTSAPAAPTVALQNDTGSSSTDRVTSVGTLVIGNREANAVVEYSTDGINWSQAFTPVEGANAVWVRQTDLAGNGSSPAALFAFTLDRVAPTAPGVFLTTDTGSSPSDKVTRIGTVGVVANESPVEVSYSVTNGIVWVTGQPTPIEGINNLLVRVTDLAGNNSPAAGFSFTYDTVAPSAPIVALLNDTGLSATDNVTTDPRLNVTGLVNGATVEYSLDGFTWGLVQPTAVEGINTVLVRQTDPAGNVSAWTAFTFTLASSTPPAVTVALQSDTGASPVDLITSNPALAVSGVVAGGVVQYSNNGISFGTGLVLMQGTNTILVRQVNAAGSPSLPTPFTFVYDSVAPTAPGLALQNDTGTSPTDRITRDPSITTSGVEAGASLQFSTNGGLTWGSTYSIAPGVNTILARQIDVAGNTSAASTISLVYDVSTPAAPGVALQNDTGSSATDRITAAGGLVISGLEANAVVQYSTDGGANWSGGFVAGEGVNTVLVRQTDAAGNVSSPSTAFTFTLDVTSPIVINVTSPNTNGTYTPGQTIVITVDLSESAVLTAGTSAVLALNTGRNAVLVTPAGTPTSTLTFNYVVQNGDSSADLDYTSSSALAVTSGSIRDVAGNDLVPTLPTPVAVAGFKALGSLSIGSSLGTNKNIVVSSLLIPTLGVGSTSATLAPQLKSAVTAIPIQFNMPVSTLTLSNFRLLVNNRLVSLKGAKVVGSGTSWTLQLPSVATNLKGIYRLDIFGVVSSSGVGMGGKTGSTYWWRR